MANKTGNLEGDQELCSRAQITEEQKHEEEEEGIEHKIMDKNSKAQEMK